jgi:hypothetical protein
MRVIEIRTPLAYSARRPSREKRRMQAQSRSTGIQIGFVSSEHARECARMGAIDT